MPLNIKNEAVAQKAAELAEKTGKTITQAVGDAVEAQLAELAAKNSRRGTAKRLLEIGATCVANSTPEWRTFDYDAEFYDERGFPK